jgi:hypothetical protein
MYRAGIAISDEAAFLAVCATTQRHTLNVRRSLPGSPVAATIAVGRYGGFAPCVHPAPVRALSLHKFNAVLSMKHTQTSMMATCAEISAAHHNVLGYRHP